MVMNAKEDLRDGMSRRNIKVNDIVVIAMKIPSAQNYQNPRNYATEYSCNKRKKIIISNSIRYKGIKRPLQS